VLGSQRHIPSVDRKWKNRIENVIKKERKNLGEAKVTYEGLGCVWIATKEYHTNYLVMTKRSVLAWIVANFLACQCSTTNSSLFF
jgi:hypothetical protein